MATNCQIPTTHDSVRQEVAAILIDHAHQMPDQTYQNILHELGNIPESRDPLDAKVYLERIKTLEDTNNILSETLSEREETLADLESQLTNQTDWGEGAISPPSLEEFAERGTQPIPDQVSDLLATNPVDHLFDPFQSEDQHTQIIDDIATRFTDLGKHYHELWKKCQTLQFNNDYLRHRRNTEYWSVLRQLKEEQRSNGAIHNRYLRMMSEQMGNITIHTTGHQHQDNRVPWAGAGEYRLIPGVDNNYCSVYQHCQYPDIRIYNTNSRDRSGRFSGREWVICDIRRSLVVGRIEDNYESYLPPPTNRWYYRNQEGRWISDGSVRLSYQHPHRRFRTTTEDLPFTQNIDEIYRPHTTTNRTSDYPEALDSLDNLWQ